MENPYLHTSFPHGVYPYKDMSPSKAVNDKSYLNALGVDSLVNLYHDLEKLDTQAPNHPSAGQLGKLKEAYLDHVQELSRKIYQDFGGHPQIKDIFSNSGLSIDEARQYIGEFNSIYSDNINKRTPNREYAFSQSNETYYLRHEDQFHDATIKADKNKPHTALNPRFRGISQPEKVVVPPTGKEHHLNPAWFIPLAIGLNTCNPPVDTPPPHLPGTGTVQTANEVNYLNTTTDARIQDNAIKIHNPKLAADTVVDSSIIKESILKLTDGRFNNAADFREDFNYRFHRGLLPESFIKNFEGHAFAPKYDIDTRHTRDADKALADFNTMYAYFPKLVGPYYEAVMAGKAPSQQAELKMGMAIERIHSAQQKWAAQAPASAQNDYYKSVIQEGKIAFTSDCNLILENYQETPLNVTHQNQEKANEYPGIVSKCFAHTTEGNTRYIYGTTNQQRRDKTFPDFISTAQALGFKNQLNK